MPPLTKFFKMALSYVIAIVCFEIVFLRVNDLTIRSIYIAFIIYTNLSLFAASLEELAWSLGVDFRCYRASIFFIKLLLPLMRVPFIGMRHFYALCATEIAELYMLSGDRDNAEKWVAKSAPLMLKQGDVEFHTLSRAGYVYYDLGDFERSKKFLKNASEIYLSGKSRLEKVMERPATKRLANLFSSERTEIQTVNLDLLAKLELHDGHVESAEKSFKKSAGLRRDVWFCTTADAYEANYKASIAIATSDLDAEQLTLAAANLLPQKLGHPCDLRVAVAIMSNLQKFESIGARDALNKIKSRCQLKLYENQKQTLSIVSKAG